MKTILYTLLLLGVLGFSNVTSAQETWEMSGLENVSIAKLLTTPYGILAAEFDTRYQLDPPAYNGVKISRDLGNTWINTGLEGRGVTDLAYDDGIIYASSYFANGTLFKNGLYLSTDGGMTWQHGGYTGSCNYVYANDGNILISRIGAGLWLSKDMGVTWENKIGIEYSDYTITALSGKNEKIIVGTLKHSYISRDSGETWEIIQDLEDITIIGAAFGEGTIIVIGRENVIFRSVDNGANWYKIQDNPNLQPEKIAYFEGSYYLSQKDLTNNIYDIFQSGDLGTSWFDMSLDKTQPISTISGVYSVPSRLFTHVNINATFSNTVREILVSIPLLQIPWATDNKNELTGRIYSYFDHRYPLLGYGYHKEPQRDADTTLNYLGESEKIPDLYYSSHDGYDFSLPYGANILAAHEGLAEYYYCKPCGNTIKINHPDGYQTTYMHLQQDGLVTKEFEWVQSGDVIGKVGMTGNTTGPHLHFAVTKGTGHPDNRVDPFGWQNKVIRDPWEGYSWTDALGAHAGSQSTYLWKDVDDSSKKYFLEQEEELIVENKIITVPLESIDIPATIVMKIGSIPLISSIQQNISYVFGTSFFIDAWDNVGSSIKSLLSPATIKIDLSGIELTNTSKETLAIYFWDEVESLWIPLETTYNELEETLTAETLHFSKFSVFGEKIDPYLPETSMSLLGNSANGWYTEYPTVSFTTQNPTDKIFYSTEEEFWQEYDAPFVINEDGIVTISYRSMAVNGNLEETQNGSIKINATGRYVKTVIIKGAVFSVL